MTQQTVLLLEADVLVRYPLAHYLRECGYRVVEAVSAAEARALISEGTLAVDIVMIDAMSTQGAESGETGFALASWLRKSFPDIVVSITGSVDKAIHEARELCDEGPALTKPYDHQAVLAYIKRLLAARERGKGNS